MDFPALPRLALDTPGCQRQRAAVHELGLQANPFKGWALTEEKKTGRDMQRDELQALLRAAGPEFRRFMIMLKLTGARPGELSGLQWSYIDWQRCIAILDHHKTQKKTGKKRILVFPP